MTNPDDSIGTNGAYGGRTSVNAFNDVLGGFSRGVLSGWACVPSTGMKVNIGGVAGTRDVAIAEDDNGNKTTINNINELPIELTIGAAPGTNTRIDAIVAYVDNPPEGTTTDVDNPGACGIIVVAGTASSTPTAPNESAIRTAITADGATGTSAYYAVLATVKVTNGTTDITSNEISAGDSAYGATTIYSNDIVPSAANPWQFTLVRCGNIVTINLTSVQVGAQGSTDNNNSGTWNIIPKGYRPIDNSSTAGLNGALIPFVNVVYGSTQTAGQWRISSEGKFYLSTRGWGADTQRFSGTATWITTDAWPAS